MAMLKGPTALVNFPVPMNFSQLAPQQMTSATETAQEDGLEVEEFFMQEEDEEFGGPSDMALDTQNSYVAQTPQLHDTGGIQLPAQPLSTIQASNPAYAPPTPTMVDLSNYRRKRTRREVDGNEDYSLDDVPKLSEQEGNKEDELPPLEDDDRVQPPKEKEKEYPGHGVLTTNLGSILALERLQRKLSQSQTGTPERKQAEEELARHFMRQMQLSEGGVEDLQQPVLGTPLRPAPRPSKPFLSTDPTGLCRACGWTGHDRSRCCTHPNEHNREFRVKRFRWNDIEILNHITEALRDHVGVECYNYHHNDPPPPRSDQNDACLACGWPGHDHHHCWVPPKYFNEAAEHRGSFSSKDVELVGL